MRLSVVSTLYRSEPYILEFHRRICAAAQAITSDFEIVFVNDGSPDRSLEIARSLVSPGSHVRVIDLSRNFGHHKAIMTGLAHAGGDLVFLLDSDLEEAPELLQEFYANMQRSSVDVVFGVQTSRKGGSWERIAGEIFYRTFELFANIVIPRNLITARLMTARYVQSLIQHRDREIFLAGLWQITGYAQLPVPVQKLSRSKSTYTLGRKLSILVNAVTSFSSRPLVGIFYLGLVVVSASAIAAAWLVIDRLFFSTFLSGWPSLIVVVLFMGGLTIFCLGVIGIYLSKIFMETKDRPYTIVRARYESTARKAEDG